MTQAEKTKTSKKQVFDQLAVNTIRFLAVDAVEKANSGHPGMPMGMAPVAYVLWSKFLRHNPRNPKWPNRDRFVLSAGHGSMLLYALLHLAGYDVSLEDLKNFRQWGSKTPGHPEYGVTPGVETTTGPLGQGIATAVGMAMAQKYLNSLFPSKSTEPLLTYHIYGIASDGDLMEGISSEAASLAGHLGLGKIIFFYDDNHISIDGDTSLTWSDNVEARFKTANWHTLIVEDANDLSSLSRALKKAQSVFDKPSLIIVKSHIGFGSPNKADTADAHGAPLGKEEVKLTKEKCGWPLEPPFFIPEEVLQTFRKSVTKGMALESEWRITFYSWAKENPEAATLWERLEKGELPLGWEKAMPNFQTDDKLATRVASGKIINALAPLLPELIGGSADLSGSNNTFIKDSPPFSKTQGGGRTIHFGVREHAMGAILNGMGLSQMLIPYGGTFLIFSDYMKAAMRIAALNETRVIYILTHDSIGLGEDGPTHQPIEQLAMLRSIPNMTVIRPADANETREAWKFAIQHKTGPVALVLTRQNVPVLSKSKYPSLGQVDKGAYILFGNPTETPELIFLATGSEVSLALQSAEILGKEKIKARVVSMPSWEIFGRQTTEYKDFVLPPTVKARLSIEALSPFGWERYIGTEGIAVGIKSFGRSAPASVLFEKFGFTVEAIVAKAKTLLT